MRKIVNSEITGCREPSFDVLTLPHCALYSTPASKNINPSTTATTQLHPKRERMKLPTHCSGQIKYALNHLACRTNGTATYGLRWLLPSEAARIQGLVLQDHQHHTSAYRIINIRYFLAFSHLSIPSELLLKASASNLAGSRLPLSDQGLISPTIYQVLDSRRYRATSCTIQAVWRSRWSFTSSVPQSAGWK